jgi:hypothetical protein
MFAILFVFISIPSWICSLAISPYTSAPPEDIRPGVAEVLIFGSILSFILLIIAGLIVYWDKANRRGWKAFAFATVLAFFGGTSFARAFWLIFYVPAS